MKQTFTDINQKFIQQKSLLATANSPIISCIVDCTSDIDLQNLLYSKLDINNADNTFTINLDSFNVNHLLNTKFNTFKYTKNIINNEDYIPYFTIPVSIDATSSNKSFNIFIKNIIPENTTCLEYNCTNYIYKIIYSNFNEILIIPNFEIHTYSDIKKFATDIQKIEKNTNTIAYEANQFTANTYGFSVIPSLNKNLKFKFLIDYSLTGTKISNTYVPSKITNHLVNKTTNITQDLLEYEYTINENTLTRFNAYNIYDCNINNYDDTSFYNTSNIQFIEENYKINRSHVPPSRYRNKLSNISQYYTNVINQTNNNDLLMATIDQDLYSQFKYNNTMALIYNCDNKLNLIKNGFLLEFSGNSEIIKLN